MSPIGKITHVVIHYSTTYPDQDLTAADIDRMHRARTPPFRCIGYHWFIRRDGTAEEGRPEIEQGAHVIGQTVGKIGICWGRAGNWRTRRQRKRGGRAGQAQAAARLLPTTGSHRSPGRGLGPDRDARRPLPADTARAGPGRAGSGSAPVPVSCC
jgi:hypothetical protein